LFSFFGLFADPVDGLSQQLCRIWPELYVVRIERPISALAIRFGADQYEPANEDIPMPIVRSVKALSIENYAPRFLLLRTECYGGPCANWGEVIQSGETAFEATGDGALRRLIAYWGIDLGPREIFEPLARDFPWYA
jgi:hypothetical protein